MDRKDANGTSIPVPASMYDLPWVQGTGMSRQTGDKTNTGWHPSLGWPKTRNYFGLMHPRATANHPDMKSERDAQRSTGNKWRRK